MARVTGYKGLIQKARKEFKGVLTSRKNARGHLYEAVSAMIGVYNSADFRDAYELSSNKDAKRWLEKNLLKQCDVGLNFVECSAMLQFFPTKAEWENADTVEWLRRQAKIKLREKAGLEPKKERTTATVAQVRDLEKKLKEEQEANIALRAEIRNLKGQVTKLKRKQARQPVTA